MILLRREGGGVDVIFPKSRVNAGTPATRFGGGQTQACFFWPKVSHFFGGSRFLLVQWLLFSRFDLPCCSQRWQQSGAEGAVICFMFLFRQPLTFFWIELDWIELNWTSSDWTELFSIELNVCQPCLSQSYRWSLGLSVLCTSNLGLSPTRQFGLCLSPTGKFGAWLSSVGQFLGYV